jgi:hypothetical protein
LWVVFRCVWYSNISHRPQVFEMITRESLFLSANEPEHVAIIVTWFGDYPPEMLTNGGKLSESFKPDGEPSNVMLPLTATM